VSAPSIVRLALLVLLLPALAACGRIHHRVDTSPAILLSINQLTVAAIEVSSHEDNADTRVYNVELKQQLQRELAQALSAKNVRNVRNAPLTLDARIRVIYGKRALRAFVGFGAGSGRAMVYLTLRDRDGNTVYSTYTEGNLRRARWVGGGDMMTVARRTVSAAVKDFSARI
jgi:hypothetical protein